MKKVIVYFTTLLLSIPTLMFAQEPNSLHVQKVDGTVQSASLVSIQYITFEEDQTCVAHIYLRVKSCFINSS